jgi:hypothetical protein
VIASRSHHRQSCDLYHSALIVRLAGDCYTIEMAPVWGNKQPDRGVVSEGAVGLPWLGRSPFFRYEVRCWHNGTIPDIAEAVASPQCPSTDGTRAQRLLDLVPAFPAVTWGRDELHAGEMWNSNSVIAWALTHCGIEVTRDKFPYRGRAPGWDAGVVVASRATRAAARAEPSLDLAT